MTGLKIAHRQRFEQVAEALGGGDRGLTARESPPTQVPPMTMRNVATPPERPGIGFQASWQRSRGWLSPDDWFDIISIIHHLGFSMPGSLVVRDLDDELIVRLKRRAARHGRSAEAEHREILRRALSSEVEPSFLELAARLRELTEGTRQTPSEDLIREGRDER